MSKGSKGKEGIVLVTDVHSNELETEANQLLKKEREKAMKKYKEKQKKAAKVMQKAERKSAKDAIKHREACIKNAEIKPMTRYSVHLVPRSPDQVPDTVLFRSFKKAAKLFAKWTAVSKALKHGPGSVTVRRICDGDEVILLQWESIIPAKAKKIKKAA